MKVNTVLLAIGSVLFCSNIGLAKHCIPPVQDVEVEEGQQEDSTQRKFKLLDPARVQMYEVFGSLQSQAVNTELKQLQYQLQLDAEWINSFESTLDTAIKDSVQSMVDTATAYQLQTSEKGYGFDPSVLNADLRKTMWGKIGDALPDGKEEAFAEFQVVTIRLQDLREETGVLGVLVFLDSQLCLSEAQTASLKELYLDNWNSNYSSSAGVIAVNGLSWGRRAIELVGQDEVKGILTAQQFETFQSMYEHADFSRVTELGLGDGDVDEMKSLCDDVVKLKIAEYVKLVGASEQQLKMLSIARVKTVSNVVKQFEMAMRKTEEEFRANPNVFFNFEDQMKFKEPVVSRCLRDGVWQKTLSKVFDKEQLQKIERRERVRREMTTDQVVNNLVLPNVQILALSYDQYVKFADAVKKQLGDAPTVNFYAGAKSLLNVSDEEYQDFMTPEQWKAFEPGMERQREAYGDEN